MSTRLIRSFLIPAFVLWLILPNAAQAEDYSTTISYLIGFPVGDTNDFIGKTSFQGVELEFLNHHNPKGEWGFLLGWQRFEEDLTNSSYTDPSSNLVITADQERSLSQLPILFNWRYHFQSDRPMQWFVSAGAGGAYVERRFFVGSFDFSDYGWQFILRPAVGAKFKISEYGGITTSLRYDYGFESGDLDALTALSIGIGFEQSF